MIMSYYLVILETKNQSMFLHSALEKSGYNNFQIVSTPCAIKTGCNYSLKFGDLRYSNIIFKKAKEMGMEKPNIYFVEKKNGKYEYNLVLFKEIT